jgi:hypothetical protein
LLEVCRFNHEKLCKQLLIYWVHILVRKIFLRIYQSDIRCIKIMLVSGTVFRYFNYECTVKIA